MHKLKRILLITTGGTIASKPTEEGLAPQLNGSEILAYVPELADLANVSVLALFNIDSTNMNPQHWIALARAIEERYDAYDAFLITHGTDTLAYTAAGLSYLIRNSYKPIVLTGSQHSIARRDTDARRNLQDALRFAVDDSANGVKVVFDGQVILGTRARKTHTKSYGAFNSIDFPPIAHIRSEKIIYYIQDKTEGEVCFSHDLDPSLAVIQLTPGLRSEVLLAVGQHCDAIIIEGFGSGGLPNLDEWDLSEAAEHLLHSGKIVVMSTQVQHEGSDMAIYQVGHNLLFDYGMPEARSMTIEALSAKLMWIMAQTKDIEQVRNLLYTKIDHDII